ncbi:hypothetical protein LCGC14_2793940, partial [marine sediment metagenome]
MSTNNPPATSGPASSSPQPVDLAAARQLQNGRHPDPFSVLGPHRHEGRSYVTALFPDAAKVEAVRGGTAHPLTRIGEDVDVFTGEVPGEGAYTLRGTGKSGAQWELDDAY